MKRYDIVCEHAKIIGAYSGSDVAQIPPTDTEQPSG